VGCCLRVWGIGRDDGELSLSGMRGPRRGFRRAA
jgi:hypothetical protein